jgi:RNA polymerase sigma factor (sigma-70 family)
MKGGVMIANKIRGKVSKAVEEIRRPVELFDPWVKTKKAAESAASVAELVGSSSSADDLPKQDVMFKALHACAIRAVPGESGKNSKADDPCEWAEKWRLIRDHLVEQNLGLAYSLVGRFRAKDADRDELRSEALFALVRAVEAFNPWRGVRFSTYACNAINNALIYSSNRSRIHRNRFASGLDGAFERPTRPEGGLDTRLERLAYALDMNLGELTEQESAVLRWRFPAGGGLTRTLREVAGVMGLSKERVRQIQNKALDKLRVVLEGDPVLQ